jgi:signal transduction histidine kinase
MVGKKHWFFKYCGQYRVPLWQCPQFLFVIMGVVIITAILVTYFVAARYEDPERAIPILSGMTAVLLIIGHFIVAAFERVAQAANSKSEFISIMSHQLRSPLSAIKWQIDAILENLPHADEAANTTEKYLRTIGDYNEQMIRLVNDLLEVNRIEDDDVVMRPTDFSLDELWRNVITKAERYGHANNVTISFGAPENLPPVHADEDRIRVVLQHLLDNAIRYSVNGGTVIVVVEQKNNTVYSSVTDQGVGVIPEETKKIFTKFFRSANVVKHQTEGSGIGLFIAKSIVKRSGGTIGFSSEPDKGSVFWFSLPAGASTQK